MEPETTGLKTLVLKGSEWLRGEPGDSMLLRPEDNKKCCLGVLALGCGATEEAISGRYQPFFTSKFNWPWETAQVNTPFGVALGAEADIARDIREAMRVNDSREITDWERVRWLTPIFERWGYRLEFRPEK